ncbi:14208_t:CDS:2, partial [Gigaspora margarita]
MEDAIIKVKKKILPSKVITNESREQRSGPKELRDMKAIKTLSILIGEIRKNRGNRSYKKYKSNGSSRQPQQNLERKLSLQYHRKRKERKHYLPNKLKIFYLDQLLNSKNNELITWQQLKKAKTGSAKGKKAKWFVEVERQTLQNSSSRLVKDKFQLDSKNQQTVHSPLFKLNKNKRSKNWIIFKDQRSRSWKLERIEKKKERKL